jgi:hypothetical protein
MEMVVYERVEGDGEEGASAAAERAPRVKGLICLSWWLQLGHA